MISREVLDERRHNDFVHESGEKRKYPMDTVPLDDIGGTLAEGYAEGRRTLHAHLRVGSEGNDKFRDYCAIIERVGEELGCAEVTPMRTEHSELVRRGCRQMRHPVLVAVGEDAKNPEGACRSRPVLSVVRLQTLDDCLGVGMDASDHGLTLIVKPGPGLKDGKLEFVGDALGHLGTLVGDGEFVSKVVEGASEVVEAVSDDGGERNGRGLEDFGRSGCPARSILDADRSDARLALAPQCSASVRPPGLA
jgi:hypothetical protein